MYELQEIISDACSANKTISVDTKVNELDNDLDYDL